MVMREVLYVKSETERRQHGGNRLNREIASPALADSGGPEDDESGRPMALMDLLYVVMMIQMPPCALKDE